MKREDEHLDCISKNLRGGGKEREWTEKVETLLIKWINRHFCGNDGHFGHISFGENYLFIFCFHKIVTGNFRFVQNIH
jgi:hypothetical protein